jgi:hypothetical protein
MAVKARALASRRDYSVFRLATLATTVFKLGGGWQGPPLSFCLSTGGRYAARALRTFCLSIGGRYAARSLARGSVYRQVAATRPDLFRGSVYRQVAATRPDLWREVLSIDRWPLRGPSSADVPRLSTARRLRDPSTYCSVDRTTPRLSISHLAASRLRCVLLAKAPQYRTRED